jgi:hypothetical protein
MPTATNTLLNISQITAKALVILHQKLNFAGSINRSYDDSFAISGAKIGTTLRIAIRSSTPCAPALTCRSRTRSKPTPPSR